MSDSTDGDLIMEIKKGKVTDYLLYERYLPMITKHGKTCFLSKLHGPDFLQDYRQEAYIMLKKLVASVDEKRITSDEWSFAIMMWYGLKKLNCQLMYGYQKSRKWGCTEVDFKDFVDNESLMVSESCFENSLLSRISFEKAFSKFSLRQKEIVRLKLMNYKIRDIVKMLKCSPKVVCDELKTVKGILSRRGFTIYKPV